MKKIKVIQISHASVSVFMKGQKTLRQMILDDWYSLTAQQIKKFYPEIEVECWTPEKVFKEEREFINGKIKYRQFPTTFSPMYALDLSIPMLKALKKEIRENKKKGVKTILHLHEYHNLHGILIAALFKDEKIIAQHHGGSWPLKHLKKTKRYKFFFPFFILGQIAEKRVLKNIACFFALSKDEIDYLKKITDSKVKFQTMGIDEYHFKKINKKTARKKLGWPLNKKIIIYLGRINYVKGTNYLIDAMEKLKDVDLKLVGWGEQKAEIENYSKSKKLKNVEFLGSIFGEKKLPYLAASDAFVLPSTKEGASVSVMEGMAQNLPIVTTDVGGMSLMIKEGREGRVIRPRSSDEIVKAVKNILKWKKKDMKEHAKIYKWEKIIDDTAKEYLS